MRRWLHELGWEWKRVKVVAKDNDPQRVEKLARIRLAFEQLRAGAALFFADELDINLLPKVGYQWMPKGEQVEVMTPGTNEKRYLAGALDLTTGTLDDPGRFPPDVEIWVGEKINWEALHPGLPKRERSSLNE